MITRKSTSQLLWARAKITSGFRIPSGRLNREVIFARALCPAVLVYLLMNLFGLSILWGADTLPPKPGELMIRGVVHQKDGRILKKVKLILKAGEQQLETRTGTDGSFEIKLPPGIRFPLELVATAPGFETLSLLIKNAEDRLELSLSPTQVFSETVEITGSRARSGDTPVPMSLIGREEIETKDWGQDVPLLLQGTPGFYAYNDNGNGQGYSYFFLRGFDMRRTAISLNGVPLNDAHSHGVYFVDLSSFLSTTEDIEVQRGVGRSLYGGSAIGGSVNMQTRTPLSEQRLQLRTMAGAWDTQRNEIQFDTGLIKGKWAATFRYSKTTSDGYRDQSWLESWNYYSSIDHYSPRATTRLILFGGPEKTHLAYEGVTQAALDGEISGNRRRDRRANPLDYHGEIDKFFQPHFQLIDTRQLGADLVLRNTLYYFKGDGYYRQYKKDRWMPEYNLEPYPGPDGTLITTTDLLRQRDVDEWDGGWIPGIEWTHGKGRGKLQAGIALHLHGGHHFGRTIWAEFYPPELPPKHPYYDYRLNKQSIQPYLEENWRFNRNLSLLAGLSFTSHRYHLLDDKNRGMDFKKSYSYLLPRLGLNWKSGPHLSFYTSISRGAREPAFRDIYDPQDYYFGPDPRDLKAEELTDYELGATGSFGNFSGKINAFYLDFQNEIVYAGGLDSDGLPTTTNGAQTTHKGAEFEGTWRPAGNFAIRMTASYNHATFDHFIEYDWDGESIDHSGNRIGGAPEWMGSLEFSGGWGRVDYLLAMHGIGKFYLDNTEDSRKDPARKDDPSYIHRTNDGYTTIDLALTFDLGRGSELVGARSAHVDLRVNNLLDRLYTTYGFVWGPEPTWIPAATRSLYAGLSLDW